MFSSTEQTFESFKIKSVYNYSADKMDLPWDFYSSRNSDADNSDLSPKNVKSYKSDSLVQHLVKLNSYKKSKCT